MFLRIKKEDLRLSILIDRKGDFLQSNLISVIIPVYNAETTISECIESVLCQTYNNFEIILVDDGSTDGSGNICKEYSEKDSRIRYIRKENGGVSSARNLGIDEAKGEYITFVDSDDWIEKDALEEMEIIIKQHYAELILPRCRGVYFSANGEFERYVTDNDDFFIIVNSEQLSEMFDKLFCASLLFSVCGRLYNKDFLDKNNIRFSEEIKILEDFCFTISCLSYMSKVIHIDKILYNYRVINIGIYQFKRDYQSLIRGTQYVYEKWFPFLESKKIGIKTNYYDFIASYWIISIQGLLEVKENIFKKIKIIRKIGKIVDKEDLFDKCSVDKIDTQYKVLFKTKSAVLFLIIDWLKRIKMRIKNA